MSVASSAPVAGKQSYEWSIDLYEYQGKCTLAWTGPHFRAAQSQLWLMSSEPGAPAPTGAIPPGTSPDQWEWVDVTTMNQPWHTNADWGAGWQAWLVSQSGGSSSTMTQIVVATPGTTQ